MELKCFFAQDAQGNLIKNPTVHVYLPGTTTTISGIKDQNNAELSNPFTGGANGQIQVSAPNGDYDLRVSSGLRDYTIRVRFVDLDDQVEEAQSILNDFRSRYYGELTETPATDPLGNAPSPGDLYSDSTLRTLRVFSDGAWSTVAHVAESDLQSLLLTPTSLYNALSDPLLPLPSFIEGWALNSFHGVAFGTPVAAGIPTDTMSQIKLEYTVSGTAGASTLTISSGDESKGGGAWGGVIQHDDGSYGLYGITSLSGGSCTVFPNLRGAVTAKTLRNSGGSVNGQHFTEPAYRALARHIFRTTRASAYRLRYAAKWDSSRGVKADWTNIGGLGSTQYNMVTSNNVIGDGQRSTGAFISRARTYISGDPTAPHTGKGLTKTFTLNGESGTLELFASRAKPSATQGFAPFRVVVSVNGATVHDVTYTENEGLQRVLVPYVAATTATVTVTAASDETGFYEINIGDVTFWTYDRAPYGWNWADSVIDKNAKTVIIGDSWTTYYPEGGSGSAGVLGSELQAAMLAAGGTGQVVSVGTGGTTAEFGLTEFDAKVKSEAPSQVVIVYFTNDHNQYGDYGSARWLTAMYKLGRKCQAIGARPIYVMPLPTQSYGQAIGHGIWANEIGAGLPLSE